MYSKIFLSSLAFPVMLLLVLGLLLGSATDIRAILVQNLAFIQLAGVGGRSGEALTGADQKSLKDAIVRLRQIGAERPSDETTAGLLRAQVMLGESSGAAQVIAGSSFSKETETLMVAWLARQSVAAADRGDLPLAAERNELVCAARGQLTECRACERVADPITRQAEREASAGDPLTAEALLKTARCAAPDYWEGFAAAARNYRAQRKTAEAQQLYQEMLRAFPDRAAGIWLDLGELYRELDQPAAARAAANSALAGGANRASAVYLLCRVADIERDTSAILQDCGELVQAPSLDPEMGEEVWGAHIILARLYLQMNKPQQALEVLSKALGFAHNPASTALTHSYRGQGYVLADDWAAAAKEYQSAVDVLGSPPADRNLAISALVASAKLYHERLQNDARAIELYHQVLALAPDHEGARTALDALQKQTP